MAETKMRTIAEHEMVIDALNQVLKPTSMELKKTPIGYFLWDNFKTPAKQVNQIPLKNSDDATIFISRWIVNLKMRNIALYKAAYGATGEPLAKTS